MTRLTVLVPLLCLLLAAFLYATHRYEQRKYQDEIAMSLCEKKIKKRLKSIQKDIKKWINTREVRLHYDEDADKVYAGKRSIVSFPFHRLQDMDCIQEIDLSDNQLEVLPLRFRKLKKINVSDNLIKDIEFPADLASSSSPFLLAELSIGFNKLNDLPTRLGELPNLSKINLDGNQLKDTIQLRGYHALESISLRYQRITTFIIDASAAPKLNYLYLGSNQIEHFALKSENTDRHLHLIELSNNQLRSVPIIDNAMLFDLSLDGNQIETLNFNDLDTNIQSLDLSDNQLISIKGRQELPYLSILDLSDNPQLVYFPVQVLQSMPNLTTLDLNSINLSKGNQQQIRKYCKENDIIVYLAPIGIE